MQKWKGSMEEPSQADVWSRAPRAGLEEADVEKQGAQGDQVSQQRTDPAGRKEEVVLVSSPYFPSLSSMFLRLLLPGFLRFRIHVLTPFS